MLYLIPINKYLSLQERKERFHLIKILSKSEKLILGFKIELQDVFVTWVTRVLLTPLDCPWAFPVGVQLISWTTFPQHQPCQQITERKAKEKMWLSTAKLVFALTLYKSLYTSHSTRFGYCSVPADFLRTNYLGLITHRTSWSKNWHQHHHWMVPHFM